MKVLSTKAHIGLFLYVTTVILPVEVGGNTICSCYTIKSQGSLWQWDRKQCQKSGGDLVAMETEDEWEFIKNRIQRESTKDGDQWYIGLYRNESTGNWTWVSGKPLTIQEWLPKRPDSDPSRNVALITRNYPPGTYGLFNNVDGKKLYKAYICEETRTSDCSGCWIHRNRTTSTPSTTEVTPRKKLTEPAILPTQEGTSTKTTTAPNEGSDTPQSSSKFSIVLILGVVLGVLFAIVVVVLGIFLFKRFRISRKSPTTKGVEEQSRPLKDQGGNSEAIYHEAAKLLGTPKQEREQTCTDVVPEYDDVENNTYAVVDKSKKKKKENKEEVCQVCQRSNGNITEMQSVRRVNENTKETATDESGPALYQALKENRSEPAQATYASLCDATRERAGASAAAVATDRSLFASYNDADVASEICYEIMPCS